MSDPWWVEELIRMRPELTSFFRRRLTLEPFLDSDLTDGITVELLERFGRERARFPTSWFLFDHEPPRRERAAFRSLVFQIAHRRLYDRLRSIYGRRIASTWTEKMQSNNEERAPDALVEAHEMMSALIHRLEQYSAEERELLLGTSSLPKSGAMRVRRHRLRQRLIQQLREDLKL